MTKMKSAEGEDRGAQKAVKAAPGAAAAPATPAPPARVAPLFRKIDWLGMALTFGVVWVVYFLTLAPELTLEDSGELVTGSMYAGIPHPPGYPVWTIYSWLWTVLVPVGNMAWRVALGEAFLGALASGLVCLMVSRGSSMFMESIAELKAMSGKWENAICLVSGSVAGLLLGLDGFMWRESVAVNRIAVTSVPWFMIVLLCLMRWLYAPHQYRFLYWALFVFGICFTTHQSLIVAALGVEVTIAAVNPRMGRDVFFGNFVIYALAMVYWMATDAWVFANLGKQGLQVIFHGVGLCSLAASVWLGIRSHSKPIEWGRHLALLGALAALELAVLKKSDSGLVFFFVLVAVGLLSWFVLLVRKTWSWSREWLVVIFLGFLWMLGASFYLYMAVSGMTNPPMQWGYPRTVDGFFHALSRGQYEQPNPTNLATEPGRFLGQVWMLINGVADEFTWTLAFIALVPFVFFFKMQKRERAWLISLVACYFFLGVFLIVLLNPTPDRASADLVKVFFNNSHTVVAVMIGFGLALTAAFLATHYAQFRRWGLAGGGVAIVLAFWSLWKATSRNFFGPGGSINLLELPHWIARAFMPHQLGLPVFGNLVLLAIPVVFVIALLVYRNRGPLFITLALYAGLPVYSGLAHWFSSNQHNHWFGYWFGHDMFTPPFQWPDGKPLYPEMTKDAILYGGTDPGRFCPTYMIFCESFTPHKCQPPLDQKFDRRDVYIITQNALADGTYLNYIRAHYNRSTQIDPPFFQELLRSTKEKEMNYETNLIARLVSPLDTFFMGLGDRVEKRRRTGSSMFTGKDFIDLAAFTGQLRAAQDPLSKYLHDNLGAETRRKLEGGGNEAALREDLAKDLNVLLERELEIKKAIAARKREKAVVEDKVAGGNTSERLRRRQEDLTKEIADLEKSEPLYTEARFKQVSISPYLADFIKENPQSHTRIRLNRLLLEAAYPKAIAKSLGGVYPDREMYIASPDDSQRCFQEYLGDAQRRLEHDSRFPNEARQIKPGEDVRYDPNSGRVTVAGQVAVMSINGLLTKVMFDRNPKNEFFVEESFPLDWMYPHLTPFGIIMKINRQPLPSLTEDILRTDHEFWKQFSTRLCGDFIDYDTSIKEIADWIETTYLRHDFSHYKGDRKFIHDDDAQKAFSKLRSSIGGVYAWRLSPTCPAEYRPKTDAEYQRLMKEAEFTFRQAFAFCPYSPEAVFRYVQLLMQMNRLDDALLIAQTCLKLDPFNGAVKGLAGNLEAIKRQQGAMAPQAFQPSAQEIPMLEAEIRANPGNTEAAIALAGAYVKAKQSARATEILDPILAKNPGDAPTLIRISQLYRQMSSWPKVEAAYDKLVKAAPDNAEAWYDLAVIKASLRKDQDALPALGQAIDLSAKRLQKDPRQLDLLAKARTDPTFSALRQSTGFQKLVPPK